MIRWHQVRTILTLSIVAVLAGGSMWIVTRDEGESSTVTAQRGPARPGWDQIGESPMPPTGNPAIAWTGAELVVFGGSRSSEGPIDFSNDAAAYDPSTGRWRVLPDAPFDPAIAIPGALTVDGKVIVAGVPCAERSDSGPTSVCRPGGIAAAVYDPSTDTWERMDPPEDPDPPVRTRDYCVSDAGLVAVTYAMASEGASPEQRSTPPAVAVRAALYDAARARWGPPIPRDRPAPAPEGMNVACTPDSVVTIPSATPQSGERGLAQLRVRDRRWGDVPGPPHDGGVAAESVWTGEEALVIGSGPILAFEPGSQRWRALAAQSDFAPARAIWAGDRAVLSREDVERGGEFVLTAVDPDA